MGFLAMAKHISIFMLLLSLAAGTGSARILSPAEHVNNLQMTAYVWAAQQPESGSHLKIETAISNRSDRNRYAALIGVHAAAAYPLYKELTGIWGVPSGKFHMKAETNDYLRFNDEVSHLFIGYKLSQGFESIYRRVGFSDNKARALGVIEAAVIMTAVEYPLDAYNPDQGFGATDLIADYAGIAFAYWKSKDSRLSNFDLKVSMKAISGGGRVGLGYDNEDYDNYVYWMTYRYRFAVAGFGYSTRRDSPIDPESQGFIGIGTTIPDLVGVVSDRAASFLRPLELYFINFHIRAF
jgi:hypothetical protein